MEKQRLPRGKLVVFDGDPELGKSTLALTFAATITTEHETEDGVMGGVWPDGERCNYSGHVLILSAEDSLADTVRPAHRRSRRRPRQGPLHRRCHRRRRQRRTDRVPGIALTDVDRLSRRRSATTTPSSSSSTCSCPTCPYPLTRIEIRTCGAIFAPLSRIAADTGCTILVLRHLNKGKGGNPLYRGGGSIAIVGAAHVTWSHKCHTDDDETLCAFAVQKNNLSAKPEALTYRIVECTNGAGQVQWVGSTDKPIHELLDDTARPARPTTGSTTTTTPATSKSPGSTSIEGRR